MAKKKAAAPSQPADFYVRFVGSDGQMNVDEPMRGQQVEYTVLGKVKDYVESDRKDGETRVTYAIEVEADWPKGTKRPENTEAMIDHEGNVDPEAAGQGGGELIDTNGAADD